MAVKGYFQRGDDKKVNLILMQVSPEQIYWG